MKVQITVGGREATVDIPESVAVAVCHEYRLEIGPATSRMARPDLAEKVRRYVVFAIDEHSRYVFIDFIKLKSEAADAVKRITAAFNATVGTPVDDQGRLAEATPVIRTGYELDVQGGHRRGSPQPTTGGSVISQASTAFTIGYGLTAVPPPGWISKWRCGVLVFPVAPMVPTT